MTGAEVHNDGEIYGAIVWRMIELFRAAYGDAPGRSRLFGYVIDGMNFTPPAPNVRQMATASASVSHGPAPSDCDLVGRPSHSSAWGQGPKGEIDSGGKITESFVVPTRCRLGSSPPSLPTTAPIGGARHRRRGEPLPSSAPTDDELHPAAPDRRCLVEEDAHAPGRAFRCDMSQTPLAEPGGSSSAF